MIDGNPVSDASESIKKELTELLEQSQIGCNK